MKTLSTISLIFCSLISFGQLSDRYKPVVLDPSYDHTKWKTTPSDLVFEFAAFTSSFDSEDDNNSDGKEDSWGIPEWVSYEIKKVSNVPSGGDRPREWMTVPNLNERGIVPNDATYSVPGVTKMDEVKTDYRFIRGHLCMKFIARRVSLDAEFNTHTTLNAVPQLQWQNDGVWKGLEFKTIEWAQEHERIWVVTGPIFLAVTLLYG